MIETRCRVCGTLFTSPFACALYCSDECRRAGQIERSRINRQREKERNKEMPLIDNRRKPPKFKSTMGQLTNDAIEVHKLGVTYGKYIAYYKGRKTYG